MRKLFSYTLGLAVVAMGLTSCDNAAMERKLENLENRVAQLEGNGKPAAPNTTPVAAPTPEPTGPLPSFEFAETEHDFGKITEGVVAEHIFKFTNNGEAPLMISQANGSCGCTVPEWPKEPIPVGGTGEIKVSFNSQGRVGQQQKFVSIQANTNPGVTRLAIRAEVEAAAGAPAE